MLNENMNSLITPVRDSATVIQVAGWIETMMTEDASNVSRRWLKDQNWSAGPGIIDSLSGEWRPRLELWCAAHNYVECMALMLPATMAVGQLRDLSPDGTGYEPCYRVPLNLDALEAFERERMGTSEFALVPQDQSWLIVLDDELYIAAGPNDFVSCVLGCPLNRVLERFDEDSQRLRKAGDFAIKHLNSVRSYYSDLL